MSNKPKTETSETFTLTDNRSGKSYELPILNGTLGPDVIDVRSPAEFSG